MKPGDHYLGDGPDLLEMADRVAAVDGTVNALERAVISELREHCRTP